MTSKNLFYNLMKEDFKRRLWTVALSFLVFFFALPVASAMITGRWSESLEADPSMYYDMLTSVVGCLGIRNGFMAVMIVFASLILGVNSFSWLHSKQKVDFYHSIPVKREKLFLVNYLDGILIPLAAYVINLVLALVVVMVNGISIGDILPAAAFALGFYMLHYALLYSVTVLAMVMTGNIVVGILGTGVFHFYFPCLFLLIEGFYNVFFVSSYTGADKMIEKLMVRSSAFALYISNFDVATSADGTGKLVIRIAAVIAVTVILAVISLILYKKRGSEAAGKAMAFKWSKPVVQIPVVILSSMLGSMFFWAMRDSLGWAVFGVIWGAVLSHCVIEILYHFDFKKLFSHRIQMVVCGIAALAVFFGFRYDIFGYDSYIPNQSAVQSMAVSFGNMHHWVDYGSAEKTENGSYVWNSVRRNEYIFDHTEFSDAEISKARSLVAKAVDQIERDKREDRGDVRRNDGRYVSFSVKYILNNGREVYRSYSVRGDDLYQDFLLLYDSPAYKRASLPIFSQSLEETSVASVQSDVWTKDVKPELTGKLLLAYQKDMLNLNSEQMKHENPIATVQFLTPVQVEAREALEREKSSGKYSSVVERGYYPIYPSFKETIAVLKESGVEFNPPLKAEDVQMITLDEYQMQKILDNDEMVYAYNDDLIIEVADEKEIAELMENAVPEVYSYMNVIRDNEKKINFEVITGNGVTRSGKRSGNSYCILMDEVPEFLVERAKESLE